MVDFLKLAFTQNIFSKRFIEDKIYQPPVHAHTEFSQLNTDRSELHIIKGTPILIVRPFVEADRYILFSHGTGNDLLTDFNFLKWISDSCGVNMVCYDYFGYGLANGILPEESKCYESFDNTLNYLRNNLQINKSQIFLMAYSLGTGVVINFVANNNNNKNQRRSLLWTNPSILVAPYKSICSIYTDTILARIIDKFVSIDKVKYIRTPMKIIHGMDDEMIKVSHGKAIYEALPNKSMQPIWVTGGNHVNIMSFLTPQIISEVIGPIPAIPLINLSDQTIVESKEQMETPTVVETTDQMETPSVAEVPEQIEIRTVVETTEQTEIPTVVETIEQTVVLEPAGLIDTTELIKPIDSTDSMESIELSGSTEQTEQTRLSDSALNGSSGSESDESPISKSNEDSPIRTNNPISFVPPDQPAKESIVQANDPAYDQIGVGNESFTSSGESSTNETNNNKTQTELIAEIEQSIKEIKKELFQGVREQMNDVLLIHAENQLKEEFPVQTNQTNDSPKEEPVNQSQIESIVQINDQAYDQIKEVTLVQYNQSVSGESPDQPKDELIVPGTEQMVDMVTIPPPKDS